MRSQNRLSKRRGHRPKIEAEKKSRNHQVLMKVLNKNKKEIPRQLRKDRQAQKEDNRLLNRNQSSQLLILQQFSRLQRSPREFLSQLLGARTLLTL